MNANESVHLVGLTTYSGRVCIKSGSVILIRRKRNTNFRNRQGRNLGEYRFVEHPGGHSTRAFFTAQVLMSRFGFRR